jgi:putative peptidoglycan binding protein
LSEIPRDLSSIELWRDSLERSLRRRALAPIARRREARLKRTSLVAGAAVATAPLLPSLGAASAASAPRKSDEPHSRRVENASQQRILLRRGDQTPAVGELQRALEIRVDDVFGRQTEAAVRRLQTRAGLSVTGRVDVQTWLTLFPNDAVIALTGAAPHGSGHSDRPAQQWAAVTVPATATAPDSLRGAGHGSRSAARPATGAAVAPTATNVVTTGSGGLALAPRVSHRQTTTAPRAAAPETAGPGAAAPEITAPRTIAPRIPSPPATPPASIPAPASNGGQTIQIGAPTPTSSQTIGDLVAEMIAAADAIDSHHYAYRWGGGHNSTFSGPYDCSGAVSAVLHAAGLLSGPLVSGDFMQWGAPGPGVVTIYANTSHVYMAIQGRFFGTSSANAGGGAGWYQGSPRPGFVVVHVPFERMHLRPSAARVQAARARQHRRRQQVGTAGTQQSAAAGVRRTPVSNGASAPSRVGAAASTGRTTSTGGSRAPAAHPAGGAAVPATVAPSHPSGGAAVPATVAPSTGTSATVAPSSTPVSGGVAAPEPAVPSPTATAPQASTEATSPAAAAPTTATPAPAGTVESESAPTAVSSPAPTEPATAPAPTVSSAPPVADSNSEAPPPADPAPPSEASGPAPPDASTAPAAPAASPAAPASAADPVAPASAADPATATGEVSGDGSAVTPPPPAAPSSASTSESPTAGSAPPADAAASGVSGTP